MKKINRRDYLLQMGAGVAGVMGSAPLDILAESRPSSAQEQTSERDLLWKPTPSLPSNPRVTAIFGGLLGFFYDPSSGNCEIGAHKGEANHRLMIEVWSEGTRLVSASSQLRIIRCRTQPTDWKLRL